MILDTVRGYACVFNAWSWPVNDGDRYGVFRELMAPRAFNLLASGSIRLDVEHSGNTRFAGTGDGSLRLWQDTHGLAFEADIPATAAGLGLRRMFCARTLQASFGLVNPHFEWQDPDDLPRRIVSRCTIDHITIAESGAYPTSTWLRSTPLNRMAQDVANAAVRWRVGKALAALPASSTTAPAHASSAERSDPQKLGRFAARHLAAFETRAKIIERDGAIAAHLNSIAASRRLTIADIAAATLSQGAH